MVVAARAVEAGTEGRRRDGLKTLKWCPEDVNSPSCRREALGMTCDLQHAWMVQKGMVRAGLFPELLLLPADHRRPGSAPLAEWENPVSDGSGSGQRHGSRAGQVHWRHLLRALPRV